MRGFSLIEMLVVIFIVSVVGLAVAEMISYFYRSNTYLLQETGSIETARKGLDLAFRNLRQASYGADGSYPVLEAAPDSITFFSDIDDDGTIEKVRLYRTGGTLSRGVTDAGGSPLSYAGQTEQVSVVASSVVSTSTPLFRYFGQDDAELPAPVSVASIRSIETALAVDADPTRAPGPVTLRASATLRNLRTR